MEQKDMTRLAADMLDRMKNGEVPHYECYIGTGLTTDEYLDVIEFITKNKYVRDVAHLKKTKFHDRSVLFGYHIGLSKKGIRFLEENESLLEPQTDEADSTDSDEADSDEEPVSAGAAAEPAVRAGVPGKTRRHSRFQWPHRWRRS